MSVHRYRRNAALPLQEIQQVVDPGGALVPLLGIADEVDVSLADDTQLPVLDEDMLAAGYVFVATAPPATDPIKGIANVIDVTSTPGTTAGAPVGRARLRYDDTQKALLFSADGGRYYPAIINPPNGAVFFEDFLRADGTSIGDKNWLGSTAGAAANAVSTLLDGSHQGILSQQTGVAVPGVSAVRQTGNSHSNVGAAGGLAYEEWLVNFEGPLAVAGENYTVMYGYSDLVGAALGFGTNAALLTHDLAVSAVNWVARSIVGGVPTVTDTGIAIAAPGTWQRIRFDLSAAGAVYEIAGVVGAAHPPAALPAATVGWSPVVKIQKLAGIAQRRIRTDYCAWGYRLSAPR